MTTTTTNVAGRRTRRAAPAWAVPIGAALVGGVVWLVGASLGADVVVRTGAATRAVGIAEVLVAALVVGLLGWAARAVLRRVTGDGRRAWLVLAGLVLALSMAGPLGATSPGGMAVLVAEHLSVGLVVMLGLAGRRE